MLDYATQSLLLIVLTYITEILFLNYYSK